MTFQNFSVKQAAEWLGLSVRTVKTMVSEGKLPASRPTGNPRGKIMISERNLHKIMDETRIEIIGKQLYN